MPLRGSAAFSVESGTPTRASESNIRPFPGRPLKVWHTDRMKGATDTGRDYKPGTVPRVVAGLLFMAAAALIWHWAAAFLIAVAWAGLAALKIEILHDAEQDGPYDQPFGAIEAGGGMFMMLALGAGVLVVGAIVAVAVGYGIYMVGTEIFGS